MSDQAHTEPARFRGRLATLLSLPLDLTPLEQLHQQATEVLGAKDPLTWEIAFHRERAAEPGQTPRERVRAWEEFTSGHPFPVTHPVALRARGRLIDAIRHRGEPRDLTQEVAMRHDELSLRRRHDVDGFWIGVSHRQLAEAYTLRARYASLDPTFSSHRDRDLHEASAYLAGAAAQWKGTVPDSHPVWWRFTLARARLHLAELSDHRAGPVAGHFELSRFDRLVEEGIRLYETRNSLHPLTIIARLLRAEAYLAVGQAVEAARQARLAHALLPTTLGTDLAWPLLILARAQQNLDRPAAVASAASAVRHRRHRYSPQSWYVREAVALEAELTGGGNTTA